MRTLRFPSILHPETTGYLALSQGNVPDFVRFGSNRLGSYLAEWAYAYETLGDGMTQHAPERLARKEDFEDYCASLASYLLANPEDIETVFPQWTRDYDIARIRAAAKVRFDGSKVRYYDRRDFKVSSSASKRNDRRWEEVPVWADGSAGGIFGLLQPYQDGLFATYSHYERIRSVLLETDDRCSTNTADHLELPGDRYQTAAAFEALESLVKAHQARCDAARSLDFWHRAKQRTAAPAEAEALTWAEVETSVNG